MTATRKKSFCSTIMIILLLFQFVKTSAVQAESDGDLNTPPQSTQGKVVCSENKNCRYEVKFLTAKVLLDKIRTAIPQTRNINPSEETLSAEGGFIEFKLVDKDVENKLIELLPFYDRLSIAPRIPHVRITIRVFALSNKATSSGNIRPGNIFNLLAKAAAGVATDGISGSSVLGNVNVSDLKLSNFLSEQRDKSNLTSLTTYQLLVPNGEPLNFSDTVAINSAVTATSYTTYYQGLSLTGAAVNIPENISKALEIRDLTMSFGAPEEAPTSDAPERGRIMKYDVHPFIFPEDVARVFTSSDLQISSKSSHLGTNKTGRDSEQVSERIYISITGKALSFDEFMKIGENLNDKRLTPDEIKNLKRGVLTKEELYNGFYADIPPNTNQLSLRLHENILTQDNYGDYLKITVDSTKSNLFPFAKDTKKIKYYISVQDLVREGLKFPALLPEFIADAELRNQKLFRSEFKLSVEPSENKKSNKMEPIELLVIYYPVYQDVKIEKVGK